MAVLHLILYISIKGKHIGITKIYWGCIRELGEGKEVKSGIG